MPLRCPSAALALRQRCSSTAAADWGLAVPRYDALGSVCLDTLQDFIAENNPDGMSPREWKDRSAALLQHSTALALP